MAWILNLKNDSAKTHFIFDHWLVKLAGAGLGCWLLAWGGIASVRAATTSTPFSSLESLSKKGKIIRFEIQSEESYQGERLRIWKNLETDLQLGLAGETGKPFDSQNLNQIRRIVEQRLAAYDFVGGKIIDIQAAFEDAESVRVILRIYPGDQVLFSFKGNKVISRESLVQKIQEQKVVGLSKDFAETLRTRIEEDYRALGYVKVSVKMREFFESTRKGSRQGFGKTVVFEINEGSRYTIEAVDFDGNSEIVTPILKEQFRLLAPAIVQNGYFSPKDIESTGPLLVEWMKSKGYLAARYITARYYTIPDSTRVKALVYLYEGDQTLVEEIKIAGFHLLRESEVRQLLQLETGQPLNLFAFNDGLQKLKVLYREKGYFDYQLLEDPSRPTVRYGLRNRVADIDLQVEEGEVARLSQVEIRGLQSTRQDVVLREVNIEAGEVIEGEALTSIESALRRLGVFGAVATEVIDDPVKPGYKQLRVSVQETTPGVIGGGFGFRNDLGVRVFGQLGYNNLWGRAHTWSLEGDLNRRLENFNFVEYQVRAFYFWPWFVFERTSFTPELKREKRQYLDFNTETTAATLTLDRKLLRRIGLFGAVSYRLEYSNSFGSQDPSNNLSVKIGSITPSVRLDLRDDPLSPTRGFFAVTSYEYANSLLGSQVYPFPVSYSSFQIRSDYLRPLGKGIQSFFSFRTGVQQNLASTTGADGLRDDRVQIPLIRHFQLGGVANLRGYTQRDFPQRNEKFRGWASYATYRAQVDFPVVGQLKMGPFADAGNLLIDRFSFTDDLRWGVGLGIRYITPVGPINFDWGFKVDRKPDEGPHEIYLSIGFI